MRKFLKSLLIISCICSLTACASSSSSNNSDQISSDNSVVESVKIEPTKEILEADIYSNKIQLGNTVITLPITLKEFTDLGFAVDEDSENKPTTICEKDSYKQVKFTIDGINYYLYFGNNTSNNTLILNDCIFRYIKTESNGVIVFPKGITLGTSIDDLKSKWGTPTNEMLNEYRYDNDDICGFQIIPNLENNTISDIWFYTH